jgi:hypothetical protein
LRATRSVSSAIAVVAVAAALIRSVAAIWFSSDVVATPINTEVAAPPLTARVLVIVVDGLRHDTALDGDVMPKLQALGRAGARGVSLASRVTMTGLGVRTLGTGTSPGLADILLETQLPRVSFDNVFSALRRRGGHTAWIGNSAWKELFGDDIDIDARISHLLNVMARADNVWGADTVIVARAIKLMARGDWQLCIVHLGGLDNASHRFTPSGEQFRAKARAVDGDIADIVAAAGPATTVIVTSDHGTSDAGHHGSDEAITRRTPLVMSGAAVAHQRVLDARQTDIAPTIAALLGLPIPAPSEGQVLVDALAIDRDTANALRTANLHQQARYAAAYAAAHGTSPPALDATPEGLRRLGDWIEAAQSSSSRGPVLWALALIALALGLLATPAPVPVTAAVAVLAALSIASGGTGEAPSLAALAVAGSSFAWRAARTAPAWRALGIGAAAIAAVELLLAIYKLHHRFLEMKMHDVYDALAVSDRGFQLLATIAAAIAAWALARRWWPDSRRAVIAIVFVASSLADSLAIPAAIALGVAAAIAVVSSRERTALGAAGVAGAIAIWLPASADPRLPLDVAAPLAVAALGAWLGPATARGRIALLGCGAAAAAVRIAGDPPFAYRATLIAIAIVAGLVARLDRDDRPLAMLGFAGAIALAMLSRSSQMFGLMAWTCFAGLVGRSQEVRASGDRAVLTATLAVVAFRFACFAVFEGVFEFSHLEVWVAYQGNPGVAVAFGAAIIATKFALPLAIGVALISGRMTRPAMREVMAWTVAFLCLRVAHIVIGMTVARGTFYSPYLDSGQLAFTCLMLASAFLLVALSSLASLASAAATPDARCPGTCSSASSPCRCSRR